MAKGRGKRQLWLLVAAFVFALLVVAGLVPNPLPPIWGWLTEERPLAPDLAWQDRIGSRPSAAASAGDSVVVDAGTSSQLRRRSSGGLISREESPDWVADWVVVAGGGGREAVVIVNREDQDGYQVHDPATGALIHTDPDAVAVWGFQQAWLDLRCGGDGRACQLRRFQIGQVSPVWAIDLPGERDGMLGPNPDLAAPRIPTPNRVHSQVSGPEPLPPLLGLTVTRGGADHVVVLRTSDGAVLQEVAPGRDERVLVAGDRVIRSSLQRHSGVCVGSVTGHDPASGAMVWGPHPYHVWSTGDVGCEQREPPLGSGHALAVVSQDGRPAVIDGYDGRLLWSGELDERVEDLSPERAVIRAADRTTRYAVLLGGDGTRLWERIADPDAGVALASCGVVVADQDPDRVYVWDPVTGENRLSRPTGARVLACAPEGVVLADGRSIGFARFDGAGGVPAPPTDGRDPDPPPEPK
jgi:hypothetical protein